MTDRLWLSSGWRGAGACMRPASCLLLLLLVSACAAAPAAMHEDGALEPREAVEAAEGPDHAAAVGELHAPWPRWQITHHAGLAGARRSLLAARSREGSSAAARTAWGGQERAVGASVEAQVTQQGRQLPQATVPVLHQRRLHQEGADPSDPPLACRQSGYCSLGRVKPWQGDVWPTEGLKASAAARSYKGELIVIGESRVNPFLQAYLEFRHLGLQHIMWVTNRKEKCDRAERIFPGELGCGWSTMPLPREAVEMHIVRVAYLSRVLRLGLNVLLIDADILLFKDPYRYLKNPPLGNANLLMMRDGNGWANCGVVYVQGAAPDGPSAYVVADVVDRTLRWLESQQFLAKKQQEAPYHMARHGACWEQDLYSDTLISAVAGRPLFYHCWMPEEKDRKQWEAAHLKALRTSECLGCANYLQEVLSDVPRELVQNEWGRTVGPSTIRTGNMTVPHFKGDWPAELGGAGFGPRLGSSAAWRSRLEADAQPVLAEQDDPQQAAKAATAPTETFTFFPQWFVSTWSISGWKGTWNSALTQGLKDQSQGSAAGGSSGAAAATGGSGPAGGATAGAGGQAGSVQGVGAGGEVDSDCVLAHFVHVPGGATNKLTVKMAQRRYNWTVAHASKPGIGPFFMSHPTDQVPAQVVAYSDRVAATLWGSEEDFRRAVEALVILGLLTNRTVAYPPVPAACSWVVRNFRERHLPLEHDHGRFICYGEWGNVKCMWGGYLPYDCQKTHAQFPAWRGALLPVETDHYVDLLTVPGSLPPSLLPPELGWGQRGAGGRGGADAGGQGSGGVTGGAASSDAVSGGPTGAGGAAVVSGGPLAGGMGPVLLPPEAQAAAAAAGGGDGASSSPPKVKLPLKQWSELLRKAPRLATLDFIPDFHAGSQGAASSSAFPAQVKQGLEGLGQARCFH